jgi:hypothetical protein
VTVEAKIVADSKARNGVRLTTFVLKYPRFIHSEFMTHRDFSRNASSSRAIPIERQIKEIKQDMAMPIEFRKNKGGMQAGEAFGPKGQWLCRLLWRMSGHAAILFAKLFIKVGVHKQYANRLLEPFAHISVIVTATRWANFFALRHHSAAQPEIAELARKMWDAYQKDTEDQTLMYYWHLPFVSEEEISEYFASLAPACVMSTNIEHWMPLIKRSVARCARVSYLNHDGTKSTQEQDNKLYDRLLKDQPIHASPAEHQATPSGVAMKDEYSGNLHGWKQFRKLLDGECIETFTGPLG